MSGPECAMELNAPQREVSDAPIGERLLVVAGAGQGKTEVVASRIGRLVAEEELSASTEILVLSFSRAAVQAVKLRLDARDIARANVRTFDSLAGRLLLDADIEPVGSFEARIRQATKLLVDGDDVPYEIETLRHVVMDEVQDLVGDRADFVLALLRKLDRDVGITALGDPLQGIYDFQLEDSKTKTPSSAVFEALRDEFGLRQVGLGDNYRARGLDPKQVIELGEVLREVANADEGRAVLDEFEQNLIDRGDIEDWASSVHQEGSRTAILCNTNAEVFRVSRYLREAGVGHVVRRTAQEFGAARWIAQALGSLVGQRIPRSEVEEALSQFCSAEVAEDRWYLLKSAEGDSRNHNQLNLSRLRTLIRSGAIPLTLTEPDTADVIVSTVHKAKGLEFERVFVVEPNFSRKDEDPWVVMRGRYVALSRARDDLFLCRLPKDWASFRSEFWLRDRLMERVPGKKPKTKRTRSVEFRYNDVEVDAPVGNGKVSAAAIQSRLSDDALVGQRLEATLDLDLSTSELPMYLLTTEDGHTIGRTSETFNEEFKRAFNLKGGSWPASVTGLSVVSVETVAGDPAKSEKMDVSFAGFWLAPRVFGLAQPNWSNMEDMQ